MEKDWITVYESQQRYNVELMKNYLDIAGIESVVLDHRDSSYPGVFVSHSDANVRLQVRDEDKGNALEILKKYNAK